MRLYDYIEGNKDRINACSRINGCSKCLNQYYCNGLRKGVIILTDAYAIDEGFTEYILGIKNIIDGYVNLLQIK